MCTRTSSPARSSVSRSPRRSPWSRSSRPPTARCAASARTASTSSAASRSPRRRSARCASARPSPRRPGRACATPRASAPRRPSARCPSTSSRAWTSARRARTASTLNVYTPAADGGRRPVLVWIHGGAFTIGSGSQRMYDARPLAKRGDVVIVTINYRLGALGFLAARGRRGGAERRASSTRSPRSAGCARTSRAFGGDPANVTIFGESRGRHERRLPARHAGRPRASSTAPSR